MKSRLHRGRATLHERLGAPGETTGRGEADGAGGEDA
jgi:hypothetical protein